MLVVDGVEMLDVRETARLVHRTPETVRRWIWSGRLPARRHGNKLLVARPDVAATTRADSRHDALPSLADWAALVERERRAGALGPSGEGTSAADLVLADRAERQAH